MKKSIYIILAIILTVSLGACTEEVETTNRTGQPLQVVVTTEGFVSADDSSTRATDTDYATAFVNGDQIGIFAITTGGEILDKNIAYKYNGASWVPVDANRVLYQYNYGAVSYVAYYPYSATMDDATGESNIISKFTPKATQTTQTDYTASDLMTCTSILTNASGSPVLQLAMKHQMSLFVIDIRSTNYITSDGYEYTEPVDLTNLIVTAGGTDITSKMYWNLRKNYRFIVPPRTAINAEVTMKALTENVEHSYTASIASAVAGKCHVVNIRRKETVERDLQIGDFFYKDGTFFPGSTTTDAPLKSSCIGVVGYVGADFAQTIDGQRYDHGLIVLKDALFRGSGAGGYFIRQALLAYNNTYPMPNFGSWIFHKKSMLTYFYSGTSGDTSSSTFRDRLSEYFVKAGGTAWNQSNHWFDDANASGPNYIESFKMNNGTIEIINNSGANAYARPTLVW